MTSAEEAYLVMSIVCFALFTVVLAWVSFGEDGRAG